MTDELKTLKDLGIITFVLSGGFQIRVLTEPELKQEAIKRVKLYIKQYNETPENMIKTRAVISGREEAIRDFFNITEEDLK